MGVEVRHVWGMTETGVGALGVPKVSTNILRMYMLPCQFRPCEHHAAQIASDPQMQSSAGMSVALQDLRFDHGLV